MAIDRLDGDITDPGSSQNAEGNLHACMAKSPNFAVEISKPFYLLSLHAQKHIFRLQPCFLRRTSWCDTEDENATMGFLCIEAQPGSGNRTRSAFGDQVSKDRMEEVDGDGNVAGNRTKSRNDDLGEEGSNPQEFAITVDQRCPSKAGMSRRRIDGILKKILPITCKFFAGDDPARLNGFRSPIPRHQDGVPLL